MRWQKKGYLGAVRVAAPHIKKVGNTMAKTRKSIQKSRRRISCGTRILRIGQFLEIFENLVLFIAAMLTLFTALRSYFKSEE